MKALEEDNELFVHVYMKSSLNAKHNMGKMSLLSPVTSNRRLALRADQKQDANSQLERETKLTRDAGGQGGSTATPAFSGGFQCLYPALFLFHTQSDTS